MNAESFRAWRKSLGFKQKDAAEKLGLKKRVIQYYERGHRDGRPVEIPRTVELACLALALGYESYDGRAPERPSPPGFAPRSDGGAGRPAASDPPEA